MIKKTYILLGTFLCVQFLQGQEGIKPLHANLSLYYPTPSHANTSKVTDTQIKKQNTTGSLFLPFKEDFSYASTNLYPSSSLWLDSNVFINTGYPIAPPSIGVATFEGLNKYGYPYNPNLLNLTQSLPADTLTSKPINLFVTASSQTLQISDNIALSFYYQARGNGESPEANDSLLLDFYMPATNTWSNNVWFSRGNTNSNTNDTVFKRGFVWIKDNAFLKDGFQFRFRNTATTAGDFDHWHLDYIYLDKGRSEQGDTVYNDLTFINTPTPFLKNYSAMPFQQYNSSEMANKISVRIRNSSSNYINLSYQFKIFNSSNQQLHFYDGGRDNLCPFMRSNFSACTGTTGYSRVPAHANPSVSYTFANLSDSADFTIKHTLALIGSSNDFFNSNDTIIQTQKFRNYYALDDGRAEAGYFVNAANGKMAMKFVVNKTDTLQALRIYFDPVGNVPLASTSYSFNIILWADGGNGPGAVIFTEPPQFPKYFNKIGFKGEPEYPITASLGLRTLGEGTYYIGFQQKVATGITVGFDRNINHNNMLYYDLGSGWTQSSIAGSIMIHPVFGKKVLASVGLKQFETNTSAFNIYPNPSNDILYLTTDKIEDYSLLLFDGLGRIILNTSFYANQKSIDCKEFPNGLYFLSITKAGHIVHQQKIIVQH
jgi:hypothetical protein